MPNYTKKIAYYVSGMHCASCEMLLEKKLKEQPHVKTVNASLKNDAVTVVYSGPELSLSQLNAFFSREGYRFSLEPADINQNADKKKVFKIIGLAFLVIAVFLLFNRLGLSALVNVKNGSSLPAFFVLGILAGLSTCAALVGGIILSLSKQWHEFYGDNPSILGKLEPHLIFNSGRIISYAVLGALLGALGAQLRLSLAFSAWLMIAVSLLMILLGLQMLGVKGLQKFQLKAPKSLARHASDETKFKGRYLPFLMGALTFFLPCGFTITAQGLALLSGSALEGSLIMMFFALGTALPLLALGFSSVSLSNNKKRADMFLKVAGIIVVFFALFNINSGLNVLGAPSLNSTVRTNAQTEPLANDLPPIVNGKQVIKMNASTNGYKPNYIKVAADVPVRWEITDTGTSGCTNALIARSLFSGQIDLTPGQTSVKEFTPTQPGRYKFSCWMGMITGTIEVVKK